VTALAAPEEPEEEGGEAPALSGDAPPREASGDSLLGSDEMDRFGLEALVRLPVPWSGLPAFPGLPAGLREPLDDPEPHDLSGPAT